ncbi:hypothetical protein CDD80_67 [Ophiocordyceps camponoti-rufipedis]|uniref:Terpene synthase n=1 Tax=Ophiocordyceps camponoti-rufipedis TaxID=2004952 RepID=A0A2C5XYG0_9HYPO|nr:hypothetical protein CDD80_67 [Ophiocordyceps camponoti-rufipedis]
MPSPRQELLQRLREQHVQLPDLQLLFSDWPQPAVSPGLDEMRPVISAALRSKLADRPTQHKVLDKMDVGLFTATYWPNTTLHQGLTLACIVIWLWVWDDDARVAKQIDQVARCFRVTDAAQQPATNTYQDFLTTIGNEIGDTHDFETRQLFLSEFKFTLESISLEQRRRLSPMLPTPEEYMATRMGTSAVNLASLLNCFANGFTLPLKVLTDPDMSVLLDQTNIIIWALNDLISLEKEIKEKAIDSLVPLLYHQSGNFEDAVTQVIGIVKKAIRHFDLVAATLANKFKDEAVAGNLCRFVDACRKNCTGSLYWSLRTRRYRLAK